MSVCGELDADPGISCSKTPCEGQSRQNWGQPGGTHGNTEAFGTQFRTGGAFPAFPGPTVLWAHWGVLPCLLCALAASLGDTSEEFWPLDCWEWLVSLGKQGLPPVHTEVGSAKQCVRTVCSGQGQGGEEPSQSQIKHEFNPWLVPHLSSRPFTSPTMNQFPSGPSCPGS